MFAKPADYRLNDQRIYDQKNTWWSDDDDDLKPLRRLVPARMAFLSESSDWVDKQVLDVGCGGGFMSEAIARLGAHVTGIDMAEGAVQAASAHANSENLAITYLQGSADSLPFEDNIFDRVVCTDVLVHVPDPALVLKEIARVLKPGGHLFFSAINRNAFAAFVMVTLGEDVLGMVPKGTHDPKTFIKPIELKGFAESVGLETEKSEGLGPIGWRKGPIFGKHPNNWVMYQGKAVLN